MGIFYPLGCGGEGSLFRPCTKYVDTGATVRNSFEALSEHKLTLTKYHRDLLKRRSPLGPLESHTQAPPVGTALC
jgi:hypothetical protein